MSCAPGWRTEGLSECQGPSEGVPGSLFWQESRKNRRAGFSDTHRLCYSLKSPYLPGWAGREFHSVEQEAIMGSLVKKRRRKMSKHKYRKRRKANRHKNKK